MAKFLRCALLSLMLAHGVSRAAAGQITSPGDLPLKPGDRLLIKVWVDTIFADSARVGDHNTVILPRLGSVVLGQLPASDIADSVRRAYAQLMRTAAVEVTPLRRVTVLGEVAHPATYYVETSSALRDAIAMAGGVTEIGATGHAIVLRDHARLNIKDWQSLSGDTALVRSGDVIWIDREPWLKRNIFSIISGVGLLLTLVYTVHR